MLQTFLRALRPYAALTLAAPLLLVGACSDDEATSPSTQPDAALDAQQEAQEAAVDAQAPDGSLPEATPDSEVVSDAQQPEAGEDVEQPEAGPDAGSADDAAPDAPDAQVAQLGVVSVTELAAELASKDFLLINVHVPYAGEIPQTDANLTYEDVPVIEAYVGADKGKKIVLYCLSNYMSTLAGNQLVAKGYWNLRYLDGGLAAWKNAGQPVEYHDL